MKNGKRPTKNQSIFIADHGLDPKDWLIVKDKPTEMVLVHRYSERTTKTIFKD